MSTPRHSLTAMLHRLLCTIIAILIMPVFYIAWAITGYEPEGKE